MAEVMRHAHGLPAADLIAQLHDDARAFAAGVPQQDDLTAVVIKKT
jgi:hypothetical protein